MIVAPCFSHRKMIVEMHAFVKWQSRAVKDKKSRRYCTEIVELVLINVNIVPEVSR